MYLIYRALILFSNPSNVYTCLNIVCFWFQTQHTVVSSTLKNKKQKSKHALLYKYLENI